MREKINQFVRLYGGLTSCSTGLSGCIAMYVCTQTQTYSRFCCWNCCSCLILSCSLLSLHTSSWTLWLKEDRSSSQPSLQEEHIVYTVHMLTYAYCICMYTTQTHLWAYIHCIHTYIYISYIRTLLNGIIHEIILQENGHEYNIAINT